ncbi:MAG: dockerin type I repeat-containing protein [Oscillospiraceae bacterium]|nr:dockerin type I repeat-containing protein [Oscillospiraceae bacterium]
MKKLTAIFMSLMLVTSSLSTLPTFAENGEDAVIVQEPALQEYQFVGIVAARYQEDCKHWDADFFNRELEFEEGEEVIAKATPRQTEDGQMVMDVTLQVPDTKTADEWARKLWLIGWFTSTEITWTPADEDTSLPFAEVPLQDIQGGTLTAVIKYNHPFDYESYTPSALNQAIGMDCIANVTRIWSDIAYGDRDCLRITLTDDAAETASAAAKALYDLGAFYAVEFDLTDAADDPASLVATHHVAKQFVQNCFHGELDVLYSTDAGGEVPDAPTAGMTTFSPLLVYLMQQYPNNGYAVQFRTTEADTFRVLEECGCHAAPLGDGLFGAVVTAKELFFLQTCESDAGFAFALADTVFDYYMDTDGIFYSTHGDGCFEEDVPQLGEFRKSFLLADLLARYPDGTFALLLETYSDTMTPEEVADWMQAQGYTAQVSSAFQIHAVMTAAQIAGYEQHPHVGFKSGLAAKADGLPEETQPSSVEFTPLPLQGDLNEDGSRDILDVILLNKYLLGSCTLTESQKCSADTTADGVLAPEDSLTLLHWIVDGTTA